MNTILRKNRVENDGNSGSMEMMQYDTFAATVLEDYKTAVLSREASVLGRREVLTGKAKFGIFGDGKELAQIAMAKYFRNGDFRSGYYRDQTFMMVLQITTPQEFFAQLYADPAPNHDPFSGGRQMVCHFATPFVNEKGEWLDLVNRKNMASDIAPTAGQMARALGLAFASKCFKNVSALDSLTHLSNKGKEICFCTIGDASTSEGQFWETINAMGVLKVPLAVFVYDDGFGISVPTELQTTKGSISAALRGFQREEHTNGIDIYTVKAWDYIGMCETFEKALEKIRNTHIPAVFHIEEATQPLGHSTSGSHERYKTRERLAWEKEWDCNKKMRELILINQIATEEELLQIEQTAKKEIKTCRDLAWNAYQQPLIEKTQQAIEILKTLILPENEVAVNNIINALSNHQESTRRDILAALSQAIEISPNASNIAAVEDFYKNYLAEGKNIYNTRLYNEGNKKITTIPIQPPIYIDPIPLANGYEILNKYFDVLIQNNPLVFAFGEDVGEIGDVNQGFAGLQAKHGKNRIFDTGIREVTIIGQALGMALRGLRPIAEVQYLDYLIYALQTLVDDVSTTHYRTNGIQSAPLIVRTRGHRLEGIWHSGSPMAMILNALKGMWVCVPRNMVQAVGMYNTLLKGNDPAVVIECLNGYRLKEKLPTNLLEMTVPLGIPEILKEGKDITLVSYGSTLRIVESAAKRLEKLGIAAEVIDVQTLIPFDIHHKILESLQKTNRILFIDEDVPGGATAFMLTHVIETQKGYRWLDAAPATLTAQPHRPAYGSDGDYFSKPNEEEIVQKVKEMMKE